MEMAEEDFEYFRGSARAKMLSRNYGYIESTETDNREQIDRIYNLEALRQGNINSLYGEFEYGNYEEMAKYMITKETEEGRITYEAIEGVEIGEGIKIKDERGIISARGYNYRKGNETGYVVISTHTKEELLKEHEEGESLPEGYENGEYIDGELYFYDGERYYDREGNEKEDTQGEISVLLSSNPYDIEAENEQIIEELNQLFMEYVEYLDSLPQPMAYRGSWPLTVKGHSGSRVFALQYLLKYRGYSPGTVDGKFGTNTYNAARNFQRSRGLVVDGKVGTNTWSKLIATFRKGSSNNAVRAIQYLLRYRYGYTAVGNVDGIYGTKTYDCSKNFQSKAGISADGVVGQNTWRYLLGSDADTSVGKNYGGGSSSSSSSGGGSGGYSSGYAATAAGMAEYAYSRIGDPVTSFFDDPDVKKTGDGKGHYQWCEPFIKYCAKKVGYKTSNLNFITDETRGMTPYNTSTINKGFTFYIVTIGGHYGMIWSKTPSKIVAIEANSDYNGRNDIVQKIDYYWNDYGKVYRRTDKTIGYYIIKYMTNY